MLVRTCSTATRTSGQSSIVSSSLARASTCNTPTKEKSRGTQPWLSHDGCKPDNNRSTQRNVTVAVQARTPTLRHIGHTYPSLELASSKEISFPTHSGCTQPLQPPTLSPASHPCTTMPPTNRQREHGTRVHNVEHASATPPPRSTLCHALPYPSTPHSHR